MKKVRLPMVWPALLLAGCGSGSYNAAYGPAVVGHTVLHRIHRAVSKHVWAQPGARLDDFEKTIELAEHENGVNYAVPETTNGVWQFCYEGKDTAYYGRFIKEKTPPPVISPAFSADEISDPMALAAKFKARSDPVSAWLSSRFSDAGRATLADHSAPGQEVKKALARELTALVYGPPIYNEGRFHGISLRPQTRRLLEFRPKFQPPPVALAAFHAALNRLLLEDAYPRQLARKQNIPWTHYYVAIP
jgi:hypothetical protein